MGRAGDPMGSETAVTTALIESFGLHQSSSCTMRPLATLKSTNNCKLVATCCYTQNM